MTSPAVKELLSAGGVGAVGPVVLVEDSFNRADNASSMGNADSGHVWTTQSGTCGIISNQGYASGGASNAIATVDTGEADIDFTILMVPGGTAGARNSGAVYRVTDSQNLLMARLTGGGVEIHKRVGGTFTLLASAVVTSSSSYILRVVIVGADIDVYTDGVLRLSHTLTGGDEVTFASQTLAGVRFTSNIVRVDDLLVVEP